MTDAEVVAWFERTEHCGVCGHPGSYCQCRHPCPCAHLHACGSGLDSGALDVFAVPPPDQEGLF